MVFRRFAAPHSFSSLLLAAGSHSWLLDQKELDMTIGTVKFFNENKGYGFIAPDGGGNDAFVHITAVERAGMRNLRENQRIGYDLQEDNRGKMSAVNLRSAEESVSDEQPAEEQQTELIAPETE